MLGKKLAATACAAAALLIGAQVARADGKPQFYHQIFELRFHSGPVSTDHIDFDPATKLIYMSRRKDGVTVVDPAKQEIVAQIAQSEASNAVAIVSKHDRGFTGNEDGTLTVFKLSDFSTIGRVKLADSTDGAIYDAATDTVVVQLADDSIIALVDPVTVKQTAAIKLDGEELERPVADGRGNIYVPIRDKDLLYKIDVQNKKIAARWDISASCQQPSGADYDPATNRVFVGCRGKMVTPSLISVDGDSGKIAATVPIGRGCDEVQFDAGTKQVFTANGVDGNVVIYKEASADQLVLQEAFATRPGARVLRYDATTDHIYVMSNAGTFDPSKKNLARFSPWYANTIFPDSLVLLTYGRGK